MNCTINEQGELLEISQEEKELEEGQHLVPLSNYYDILNLERYDIAIWSFDLLKWVGVGEQRPIIVQQPTEIEILQAKLNSASQQLEFQEELIVEMAMIVYQ